MQKSSLPFTERATFGGGCFWGVEEFFRTAPGVLSTRVGYAGGRTLNPTYEQICTDATGHAEVVEVIFDPSQISYDALLAIFFSHHNPTCLNYQGPDFGSQYRSVIFTHSDTQKKFAEEALEKQKKNPQWTGRTIVTQILPAPPFYPAEDYHQQYLKKRGLGSCHL